MQQKASDIGVKGCARQGRKGLVGRWGRGKSARSQARAPGLLHLPGGRICSHAAPQQAGVRGPGAVSLSRAEPREDILIPTRRDWDAATSECQELPEPLSWRLAGKGSGIPRKTQLTDSSYLAKSRIGGVLFCLSIIIS